MIPHDEIFADIYRCNKDRSIGELLLMVDDTIANNMIIVENNPTGIAYIVLELDIYTLNIIKSNGEHIGIVLSKDSLNLLSNIKFI